MVLPRFMLARAPTSFGKGKVWGRGNVKRGRERKTKREENREGGREMEREKKRARERGWEGIHPKINNYNNNNVSKIIYKILIPWY